MKPKCLLIIVLISLPAIQSYAQMIVKDSSIQTFQESLPPITIKKNIPLFTISIITGYYLFGANANEYFVGNQNFLSNRTLKPYLEAVNDKEVNYFYQTHRDLRPVYFGLTSIGTVVYIVGISKSISKSFSSNQMSNNDSNKPNELIIGGGMLIIGGIVTRIISFSNLRKSVNRYNQLRNPINLGASSSGIGFGVIMSF